MKVRSSHIIVLVGGLIVGFVLVVAMREKAREANGTGTAARQRAPFLEWSPKEVEMGIIPNDRITYTPIKITNSGTAPARILKTKGSCPCTLVTAKEKEILPGQTVEVMVGIDPGKIYSFRFAKKIAEIYTSDPNHASISVEFKGKIDPEFELEPSEFRFGTVTKGEKNECSIILRQLQEEPLHLLDVHLMGHSRKGIAFEHKLLPREQWKDPNKNEYLITAKLLPDIPPGDISVFVVINTDCKRLLNKGIAIALKARVETFYTLTPKRFLQIGRVLPGTSHAAIASIQADRPIHIENIKFEDSRLTGELVQGENKTQAQIAVSVKKDAESGTVETAMTFDIVTKDTRLPESYAVFGVINDQEKQQGQ